MAAQQFYAWSHSRLNMYEECPARAKYTHLDKLPVPDNPQQERGTIIHYGMEMYLSTPLKEAPTFELKHFEPPKMLHKFESFCKELKALDPMVEQEWGFTDSWKPTGWFGKDTWFRQKGDAVALDGAVGIYVDWKSGKPWGSGEDQAEQTAIAMLARYGELQEVQTYFAYLDTGDTIYKEYFREDLAELKRKWVGRANVMLNDTRFSPRQGAHCRRCHFRASNNGPCVFG